MALPGFDGLLLRPLTEGDAEALSRFYQELSPRSEYFFRPYRDTSPEAMVHVIRQSLGGREDGYVALDRAGRVVGHIFFGDLSRPVPHLGIGLADDYQDSGLGTVLMQFLISVGRKKLRKRAIGLSVMKTNTRAIEVYHKCGFRISGECTFRSDRDSYVMELDFGAGKTGTKPVDGYYWSLLGVNIGRIESGTVRTVPLPPLPGEPEVALYVLLRLGRGVVAARPASLPLVEPIVARAPLPEALFSEEMRTELCAAAGSDLHPESVRAEWSVVFGTARSELASGSLHPARLLTEADGDLYVKARELWARGRRPVDSAVDSLTAGVTDGEVAAVAAVLSRELADREVVRVGVRTRSGFEGRGYGAAALLRLIDALPLQGRTVLAEAPFDDVEAAATFQSLGMRKVADVFRVEVGS